MKKLTIALLCILPCMANAEDLSSIYGKCPQVQVSQLYDVTFVEQTLKQYQQLEALASAEYDRINTFLANERKSAQSAAKNKQPQMNAQQK